MMYSIRYVAANGAVLYVKTDDITTAQTTAQALILMYDRNNVRILQGQHEIPIDGVNGEQHVAT